MRVDAHQHFWNLDKVSYPWLVPEDEPIYRSFEPPELEPLLREAGIDKTVVVQAANSDEDTQYMLELAAACDWVGAVVGWVPLDRPDEAARKLELYAANPRFAGVRHLIHEEPDPDWVVRPEVVEGLKLLAERGLTFDVVAATPQLLRHVPELAARVPGLRMVIDHLGSPPIRDGGWEPWASLLAEAARCPNVCAKLSGLNTLASDDWSAAELQRYVDFAIDRFGANRLLFGSDWPVANLNGDYGAVWRETNKTLSGLPGRDLDAILGGTAAAFYRMPT